MSAERSSVATHAELMREMGSPDGFDPMPPSQHAYQLDVEEPETNRAIAWVWAKTIRPGKGHRRSPFARDERGALTLKHAAADLGWEQSNASRAFAKLERQGRIRKDQKGHFYLEGKVPEPRRINSETTPEENRGEVICTDNLPRAFRLYLQHLPKNESLQREQDYFRLQEYRKKLEADAMAAARATGQELESAYFDAIGFKHKNLRGRPKLERDELAVQLSLTALPELSVQISRELSVQISNSGNSVQNGGGVPYKNQNGSVQITPSLFTSEKQSTEVSKYEELALAIEKALGIKPPLTHPKLAELEELAKKLKLPIRSVCRWIFQKCEAKAKQQYPIDSIGALCGFAKEDLELWARQNRRAITADVPTRQTASRKPPEPEAERTNKEKIQTLESWLNDNPDSPARGRLQKELAELREHEPVGATAS